MNDGSRRATRRQSRRVSVAASTKTISLPPLRPGSTHQTRLERIEKERSRWLAELEDVKPDTKLRPLSLTLSHSAPQLSAGHSPLHVPMPSEGAFGGGGGSSASAASSPSKFGSPLDRLKGSMRQASLLQRTMQKLSHPPPNLERQAGDVYGETIPEPIAKSAQKFDSERRVTQRQARLAMQAVREDPASPRAAIDFQLYLSELFWSRYNLNAPVERNVEAYPDAVWGVSPDKLGQTLGYDRPRPSNIHGFAFTGSPERGKAPVRPKLPALRGETQRPTMHTLLPDSHFALGAFGNDGGLAYAKREKVVEKRPWTIEDSIFRARKYGPNPCDSKDFWDTRETLDHSFGKDWGTTTGAIVLSEVKANGKASTRSFGTTKCNPEQLCRIKDELKRAYPALLQIFTYYATIDAATSGSIFGITKIGYTTLCRDCGMIGAEGCDEGDAGNSAMMKVIDLTWIAVNESMVSKAQDYNAKGRLTRWELLEWAVRMAFERYSEGKSLGGEEMTQAVTKFLNAEINGAAQKTLACFPPPNAYRTETCYNEEMDDVLKQHEGTLRALFDVYAFGSGDMHDKLNLVGTLVYDEYLLLLTHLDWCGEIGDRKVAQCYGWSRMLSADEHTVKGRARQLGLFFEDFLEAVVRVAEFKALPTDAELKKAEHTDAGEYVHTLRSEQPDAYDLWVRTRQKEVAEGRGDPKPRRVHHMLRLIVHIVQENVQLSSKKKKQVRELMHGAVGDGVTCEEVAGFRKGPRLAMAAKGASMGASSKGSVDAPAASAAPDASAADASAPE